MLRKIRSQGLRYVFLTNGGGSSEQGKANSLQKRLKLSENEDVIRDRVIQSHTPMQGWERDIKENGTVFITGSNPETARRIARV